MIQQGLNQLLTQTAYFMQPMGERKRDEKAFNKAQEEAEKRTAAILEQTGTATNLTDEQLEYAANLQSNAAKAQFERNPTAENLQAWSGASSAKEEIIGNIAEDRRERAEKEKKEKWAKTATEQIKQDIEFEKLKWRLRKEAGLD